MEEIKLRKTKAPYTITIDNHLLQNEVMLVEQGGRPVAEYEAFHAWRQATKQTRSDQQQTAFARERGVFEQLLPQLLRTYPGKVVAIYQE